MANNPFIDAKKAKAAKITAESLEAYAGRLNQMPWVSLTGGLYFINKRLEPDKDNPGELKEVKFLDRHI